MQLDLDLDYEELFELIGFWMAFPFMLLLVGLVWYVTRRKCPKCATRGSLAYVYERNGRPDKRFKHNPLMCLNCKFQLLEDGDKGPIGT